MEETSSLLTKNKTLIFRVMKILKTLIVVLMLTGSASMVTAQAQYDVRFNNASCTNGKILVDIEVKATEMNTTFNLSEQNYRFTFNQEAIANPTIAQELKISGTVSNSLYSAHNLRGSKSNVVSYNVELAGGEGYEVNDDWVGVGRLSFDMVDATQCMGLAWNTAEQFPSTFVGKAAGNSRTGAEAANFGDLNDCDFCRKGGNTVVENTGMDVYPNPAIDNEQVSLTFFAERAQNATVVVTDLTGRTISSQNALFNKGENIVNLKHQNVQTGTYLVQVRVGNDVTATKKFVKFNR